MQKGDLLIALVHDFILISNRKFEEISLSGIYNYKDSNPENVVQLHDDMFGYMQDSLKWIETINPDKNESALGFNYYGRSIIEKTGAVKLTKLMKAWYLMFSEAPEDVVLTGWYTWSEDGDSRTTGAYEKLSFNRKEILDTLSKIIELSTMVESSEYKMIYLGI
ncbi:hypothetical protein [Paenibacillus popilliae]|uniref:Uncharacterized protein n=1 Tax=Paenibacillus popilliae TaxID=78057 RepID=A0ABY3AVF6_PAEPP|nr:hypothetical protein [Paenibacillus sp. SDF0028]TQR46396.1 hypothetical protein C7Y44_01555 [Paenibacillus sp. SDF0028]